MMSRVLQAWKLEQAHLSKASAEGLDPGRTVQVDDDNDEHDKENGMNTTTATT